MVKFYPSIPPDLRTWALSQPLFFIASAPLSGSHINLSPKGLPASTFTIFSPNRCGYIDATGSGAETIAHIYENGRATVMFCSFETAPRIMRFFCRGRVVECDDEEFGALVGEMGKGEVVGARAVVLLDVFKVQTSCGYGVPLLPAQPSPDQHPTKSTSLLVDRATLGHWAGQQVSNNKMLDYRAANNRRSLDDLGGLRAARRSRGEWLWVGDVRQRARRVLGQWEALIVGALLALVAIVLVNELKPGGRMYGGFSVA